MVSHSLGIYLSDIITYPTIKLIQQFYCLLKIGMSNGGSDSIVKNARPVTAKGEFIKTADTIPKVSQNGKVDNIELTELNEVERGHTPSPTKTQSSEVSKQLCQ